MPIRLASALRTSSFAMAIVAALACGSALTMSFAHAAPPSDEAAYLAENDAVMNKMMVDMAARPTGDVARDFVAMMEPHHQGAIDMAQAYLRHGNNEQLRRVAQEIIVEQQQEIIAMRLAVGRPLPSATAAPTQQPAPGASVPSVAGTSHAMMHMDPRDTTQKESK